MDKQSPKSMLALRAIERARKLLNRAADESSAEAEREMAMSAAVKALSPFGLTIDDLKEQPAPGYLVALGAQSRSFNDKQAMDLADRLKRGGWNAQDPRDHGHKNRGRNDVE